METLARAFEEADDNTRPVRPIRELTGLARITGPRMMPQLEAMTVRTITMDVHEGARRLLGAALETRLRQA